MIDLHCHILPGIDDGASSLSDSVAMARAAVHDGIRTIVATPHDTDWAKSGGAAEARRKTAKLRSELAAQGVELELLTGLEVYLTPEVPSLHARGLVHTLNASRYMLVEFPLHTVPPYAEQTLFELQLQRLVPVIAHPERNSAIAADPGILQRFVERGMLVQVTADSLTGGFGPRARDTAELLVAHGMAHIIASDGHSPTGRPPVLSAAVERAARLVGMEAALAMVTTTPAAVVHDEEIAIPEPGLVERRSWFHFLHKR